MYWANGWGGQKFMVLPEVNIDESISISAAGIRIELKLPVADSIIYATARMYDATIWTQDSDFKGLENVKFFSTEAI